MAPAGCVVVLSVLASLLLAVQGESGSSAAWFVDNAAGDYLQRASPAAALDDNAQGLSPSVLAAVTATLVGVNPPADISAAGSAQMDSLLRPDPFRRPQTVLTVIVSGADEDTLQGVGGIEIVTSNRSSLFRPIYFPAKSVLSAYEDVASAEPDQGATFTFRLLNLFRPVCASEDLNRMMSIVASSAHAEYFPSGDSILSGAIGVPLNGKTVQLDLNDYLIHKWAKEVASLHCVLATLAEDNSMLLAQSSPGQLLMLVVDSLKEVNQGFGAHSDRYRAIASVTFGAIRSMIDLASHVLEDRLVVELVVESSISHGPSISQVALRSRRLLDASSSDGVVLAEPAIAVLIFTRRVIAFSMGIILVIAAIAGSLLICCMPVIKDTLLYPVTKW
eukprot:jgi/Chlat1/3454/Chrsp23S03773